MYATLKPVQSRLPYRRLVHSCGDAARGFWNLLKFCYDRFSLKTRVWIGSSDNVTVATSRIHPRFTRGGIRYYHVRVPDERRYAASIAYARLRGLNGMTISVGPVRYAQPDRPLPSQDII